MGVTINKSPQEHTPSDNPVTWVFSSNQTAQPNFYFGVTVYVNGNVHSFHEIVPESGDFAKFDASEITSVNCTHPPLNADISDIDGGNYCTVYLNIQEYYGNPPTLQGGNNFTDVVKCWKARLPNNDWTAYSELNYLPSAGRSRWLTDCPLHYVGRNDEMWLCVITEEGNKSLRAVLYDINGGVIATHTTATSNYDGRPFAQFRVDPNALMVRHGFTLSQINQTAYYDIGFGTGTNYAQERIFIDHSCYDTDVQIVYFLSLIGSIEMFRFVKLREDSLATVSKSFERSFGRWVGNDFEYNNLDGQQLDYLKSIEYQIKLSSDWISEALSKWIAYNIFTSPVTFLQDGRHQRVKVLENGTAIHNEKSNNPLYQQFIELRLSAKDYSPLV